MRRYVGAEETTMEQLGKACEVLAGTTSKRRITSTLLEAFEEKELWSGSLGADFATCIKVQKWKGITAGKIPENTRNNVGNI